jgi:hypothetical protein
VWLVQLDSGQVQYARPQAVELQVAIQALEGNLLLAGFADGDIWEPCWEKHDAEVSSGGIRGTGDKFFRVFRVFREQTV